MSAGTRKEVRYTCRKCAAFLFDRAHVMHEGTQGHANDGIGVSDVKSRWRSTHGSISNGLGGTCSSVFIQEPPSWAGDLDGNEGRLVCPQCKSRVGSFSWSGLPCSCGKWVTPAFQFQLSKIDPKGLVIVNPCVPVSLHPSMSDCN